MKFYTHKTTSISVIDAKFHKNSLFRLRDFQFFQTVVTNLRQRLPAIRLWWLLHLPARQCPSPPCPWDGCATVSWDSRLHQPTGLATKQSRSHHLNPVGHAIWGILQERVYRCQIRDVDHLKEWLIEEWRRFDQNIIDREQWISGMIDCINVYARIGDTSNIIMIWTCWLFRLTSTACAGNSWLVGNVI